MSTHTPPIYTRALPQPLLAQLAALTPAELARLPTADRAEIDGALTAHERWEDAQSFRSFLTSPHYCGLDLSPMVAAIVDASEGRRPDTIDDATSERYFGCGLDALPRERRRTVAVQAGGRGGKTSRLLAPKALHAAWTVPLPTLGADEHAVALIVSSELVFARQALSFCVGYVSQSPALSAALVGEPGADSLTLRRPDGGLVDVRVRAAGARGKGGRAFTLVGAFLDEACFFFDESGVVNDREIVRACSPRIVPGGQLWMVSTPWIEGVGVLEEELASNWGAHAETLAVRGVGTRALNPTWDPTGEIEAKERRVDPENADREIGAKALTAGSSHFFSREAIEAIFDDRLPQQLPPRVGVTCAAGGDTGFVKNSSALAIVERDDADEARPTFRLALLEERKPVPGLPLKPEVVAGEFADLFLPYGTREFVTDSHEVKDVADALLGKGCSVLSAPPPAEAFKVARNLIHEGRFRAAPNPRLRAQLRAVTAKPMPGGGTQITSPKSPDGSHGDLVSALVRAIWRAWRASAAVPAIPRPTRLGPRPRM